MKLLIGNKCYSSWSLRAWLLMRAKDIAFTEQLVLLDEPGFKEAIFAAAPGSGGTVPTLVDDDVAVWETLAIVEYLHEKRPGAGIWPSDAAARAHARAISSEMLDTQRLAYDNARTAYNVAQAQVGVAESNLKDTLVRAPFSGVVTVKVAQVGEVVAPSAAGGGDTRTGIITIVDMDSLEVLVDVSENYIERVRVGGQATIHLDSYPDWDIPGSVIAIIPTADQSKGTVQVRVSIKARDTRILPQMAARVSFLTPPEKDGSQAATRVTIPPNAVQVNGRTGSVFVLGENDTVEKREVALGLKTDQAVVVLSGIAPGDRLASGDLSKLHDGERVKIAE